MKTKSSTVSTTAKLALLAAFASTASFLIAAESTADTTSRGASTPRNSSGVYTPNTPSRDIGTIEIQADRQADRQVQNTNQERRTITAMQSNEIKDDQVVIPLKRESVNVSKRMVNDGSVRLRKVVHTETVSQPVELRREMLVLERVPQGSLTATASMPADFEEGEILLPITREEVVITKNVQTDQVLAYVTVETSRQDVNERVRSENIELVDRGNDRVRVIGDITKNTDGSRADTEANRVAFAR